MSGVIAEARVETRGRARQLTNNSAPVNSANEWPGWVNLTAGDASVCRGNGYRYSGFKRRTSSCQVFAAARAAADCRGSDKILYVVSVRCMIEGEFRYSTSPLRKLHGAFEGSSS